MAKKKNGQRKKLKRDLNGVMFEANVKIELVKDRSIVEAIFKGLVNEYHMKSKQEIAEKFDERIQNLSEVVLEKSDADKKTALQLIFIIENFEKAVRGNNSFRGIETRRFKDQINEAILKANQHDARLKQLKKQVLNEKIIALDKADRLKEKQIKALKKQLDIELGPIEKKEVILESRGPKKVSPEEMKRREKLHAGGVFAQIVEE